jgi:O-antigen ligase
MAGMTTMILLVVMFAAVVVPQAWKARTERHQDFLDSIHLHAGVERPPDGPPPARRPPSTLARRRTVFKALLASVGVSAVAAVVFPAKASLIAQLAVDNCLLAYVGQLVRWRDARSPVRAPVPAPDMVLTPSSVQPALRIG